VSGITALMLVSTLCVLYEYEVPESCQRFRSSSPLIPWIRFTSSMTSATAQFILNRDFWYIPMFFHANIAANCVEWRPYKLTVTQGAKKFAIFYAIRRLITSYASCPQLVPVWATWIQSLLSLAVILASILMSFQIPQGLWNPHNRRCTACLCHAFCVFRSCHPV